MRPIARSTPDRRHRTAPDEHPDMRLKSADQSMITDVSRLRPHLCTIITSITSNSDRGGGRRAARPALDKGHQSKMVYLSDHPVAVRPSARRKTRRRGIWFAHNYFFYGKAGGRELPAP